MTTPTIEQLKALVQSPHWWWLSGQHVRPVMADGTIDDVVGVVVDDLGNDEFQSPVAYWPDIARETRHDRVLRAHHPFDHLVPAHDSHTGCLLALVREAWGCIVLVMEHNGEWWCVRPSDEDPGYKVPLTPEVFKTEFEALAAALMAAPGKV